MDEISITGTLDGASQWKESEVLDLIKILTILSAPIAHQLQNCYTHADMCGIHIYFHERSAA